MSRSRIVIAAAAVAAIASLLVSCSSEPASAPTPAPTPSVEITPTGDGVLRIGTLFPATGGDAASGAAQVAGVEAAVREINESGGVLGKPVEIFHRDSGDGSDLLERSFGELLAKSVDTLIGPSTTELAERLLPAAIDARVPIMTPAAVTLDTAESDRVFLFRTTPSSASPDRVLDGAEPDDAFRARVRTSDPGLTDFRFAAEAYDATILVALAAAVSNDDGGASLAARMSDVAAGGIACTGFGECLEVLTAGHDIDFEGVSGGLEQDESVESAAQTALDPENQGL